MEAGNMTCRVSQGSILEPLLFLIYVNAIPQASSTRHTQLYACNTHIFYQNKEVTEIENV